MLKVVASAIIVIIINVIFFALESQWFQGHSQEKWPKNREERSGRICQSACDEMRPRAFEEFMKNSIIQVTNMSWTSCGSCQEGLPVLVMLRRWTRFSLTEKGSCCWLPTQAPSPCFRCCRCPTHRPSVLTSTCKHRQFSASGVFSICGNLLGLNSGQR